MKPGIVSREEYDGIDAVNWSTLKHLETSGLLYQYCLKNQRADTPALAIGRATHSATFEIDRFVLEYAVKPEGMKRRSNAGKAAYATMLEANVGKTIISSEEHRACLAMRDALKANPLTARYIASGKSEVPIVWKDPESQLWCKARLDFLSDLPALVDLKTCRSVDGWYFGGDATNYLYHGQMAHYRNGCRVLKLLPDTAPTVILAVEKKPPHDTAVFRIGGDRAMYAGEQLVARLLMQLKQFRSTGEWRRRYQDEQELELRERAFDLIDTEI